MTRYGVPRQELLPILTVLYFMRLSLWLCGLTLLCAAPIGAVAQEAGQPASMLAKASLEGTIQDGDGALLPGARVEVLSGGVTAVAFADEDGVFHAYGVTPGTYRLHITAIGFFADTRSGEILPGEEKELDAIELRPEGKFATVTVTATEKEIATEQVNFEMKQRVLGIVPNFYVVYDANPEPLTKGQKFHLAWRSTLDPFTFATSAIVAGVEQSNNSFSGYGTGASGYAKRYGASFADGAISTFLGGAILPVVFHQDPRYRYQGTGSIMSRTRHAAASVIFCRNDQNKVVFNYSNIIGNFASAGISNLYYPASDRNGAGLTLQNAAIGTAFGVFGAIMQEFVVPKLTPHLQGRDKR
ncbi:carboxypeptidase-like regulatory domain-containing protein [Terriglobus roseus]|uniref:Carboxypeptidase regulatory-like domain-containing protein n=1 Tax=Terriglobus roseus TaxID=392734 RepID=A0A1G7LN27_9BACT|nr:carboxypeptidase-like regulatory domain-containing protein [Terriglobus roseus]SDF50791.1 Carboxypeptidase regulatory-like domain-containing protein [Terriglobus roseus]